MSEPTPQRAWRAPCPACGAPVEFKSAQSAYAICPYCHSTVVREGELLQRIGKMAELFDDHSPLQLGAAGRYEGQAFQLVGRLQYRYPEGTWTEWAALLADGSSAWLSEDNGAYVFSRPAGALRELPAAERFRVGASTALGGQRYTVTSNTQVSLIAAQGELPRLPALGTPFAMVELRSEGGGHSGGSDAAPAHVISVDYGSSPPTVSEGRAVQLDALAMTGLKHGSAQDTHARQFACPNCGAPVTVQLEQTQSCTCPQCGAIIDLSGGIGGELRHALQDEPVRPLIPLGSTGALRGASWQVVGFQHRSGQSAGDDETFGWSEYLLYNRQQGFCFLVDSEEGWSLVRPLTGAPRLQAGGARAIYDNITYSRNWQYRAETTYVLGEFYWQVQRGQVTQNSDYASGNKLLSSEQNRTEITWSGGEKLPAQTVAAAFRLGDKLQGTDRLRLNDAAPFSAAPSVSLRTVIVVLVLVILVLAILSRCDDGGGGYVRSSGGSFGGYSAGGGHK